MNRTKRDNYLLQGSIHTFSIKSPGEVELYNEDIKECIETSSRKNKLSEGGIISTSKINLNKMYDEDVLTFSEFEVLFETLLSCTNIEEYAVVRADFRLDSFSKEHYEEYAKLNKYIISALAETYSIDNCYKSLDMWTDSQLSMCIKNKYMEAEHYDKQKESHRKSATQSRLEFRSKNGLKNNKLDKEFVYTWSMRFNKALRNLDKVQHRYNEELSKKYHRLKNAKPSQFSTVKDFIMQHQQSIFTKQQLIELLEMMGQQNAKSYAENYKKRYGIEYFTQKDVEYAMLEIQRAMLLFFES